MHDLLLFFHVAAAIFWMGGMAFMVLALRPALGLADPPVRVRVLAEVLRRFFAVVAVSIAILLVTGGAMMAGQRAPMGWYAMAGLGVVMMLVFGHIYFAPWPRLKAAAAREEWPAAAAAAGRIALLAKVNLGIGWVAIAAVMLWR